MEGINVVIAVELLLQEEMENDRPLHRVHRRRQFRGRSSFFELTDQQCVERYRFDKATIQDLCLQLQPLLEAPTRRNYPIPVHLKVTTALAFLATGSFHSVLASSTGLTQPGISNCLTQFLNAFLTHTRDYISFPTTPQALQDSMRRFYNVAQFPSVIGVVDCTHIALRPPRADEASYQNRKAFHSMNMQVVCNSEGEILDVCARYPGSTGYRALLYSATLRPPQESNPGGVQWSLVLADRGYPQRVWLMTPIVHPHTAAEEEYNRHHRATRSIIERTFGQLKNHFRCLDRLGGQLLYRPEKVAHIFVACCMLHNLALRKQLPLPDPPQQQPDADDDEHPPPPHCRAEQSAVHEGFNARHHLIQTHFV
uniref:Putative nuclease HARBI1 n=1 Tax=Geotrypetes seraphini TaxID=260995 RepID=A0A6P8QSG1_GEOSA|nr:putative nuclease HARBI1 [Geotrypetes seraphini]